MFEKYIFQVHLAVCNNITLKLLENVPSDEHYSLKNVRTFLKFVIVANNILDESIELSSELIWKYRKITSRSYSGLENCICNKHVNFL